MKRLGWRVKLALALVATSAVLMVFHYFIFRDVHHLAIFSVHEIAMMPIEVLVVTMLLHSLLVRREREETLHKLNMVIGAFFSEVGDELLRRVSVFDTSEQTNEHFLVTGEWDTRRYQVAGKAIKSHDFDLRVTARDLEELRSFVVAKRQFLLGLLQNPSLLEHETFTNVLWAVFHLTEELERRHDFESLPESDVLHLTGDLTRAYAATALEWLDYVQHLQSSYPYLFSLAVRTNPLDTHASVTVSE